MKKFIYALGSMIVLIVLSSQVKSNPAEDSIASEFSCVFTVSSPSEATVNCNGAGSVCHNAYKCIVLIEG